MLRLLAFLMVFVSHSQALGQSYELLTDDSVYFVNNSDHEIGFVLITDDLRAVHRLGPGKSMIYRIVGPDTKQAVVEVSTGEKTVKYRLKAAQRYVLFWNSDEMLFDVGLL